MWPTHSLLPCPLVTVQMLRASLLYVSLSSQLQKQSCLSPASGRGSLPSFLISPVYHLHLASPLSLPDFFLLLFFGIGEQDLAPLIFQASKGSAPELCHQQSPHFPSPASLQSVLKVHTKAEHLASCKCIYCVYWCSHIGFYNTVFISLNRLWNFFTELQMHRMQWLLYRKCLNTYIRAKKNISSSVQLAELLSWLRNILCFSCDFTDLKMVVQMQPLEFRDQAIKQFLIPDSYVSWGWLFFFFFKMSLGTWVLVQWTLPSAVLWL